MSATSNNPELDALLRELVRRESSDDAAITAIASHGQDAIPTVLGLLAHWNWWVCYAAIRILARIGDPAVPALRRMTWNNSGKIFWPAALTLEQNEKLADMPAATLTEALQMSNPVLRYLAVKALGKRNDQTVVPLLIELLDHDKRIVRDAAASALAHMHRIEGLPYLVAQTLYFGVGFFPAICAEGMFAYGHEAFPALYKALEDGEDRAHNMIINYLSEMEGTGHAEPSERSGALPLFLRVLERPQNHILLKTNALGVMGHWAIPESIPVLAAYLKTETPLAYAAAAALEMFGTTEAQAAVGEWRAAHPRKEPGF